MVFEKIKNMIVEQTGLDSASITMDSTTDDLGLDSLDIVELIMSVETEWDVIVEDDAVIKFKTVGDVVTYIESKI